MARVCTICFHPERAAIEAALVAGDSFRHIASHYSVGYKSVERHKDHCMKPVIVQAIAKQDELTAFNALADMEWLRTQSREIYKTIWNEKEKDPRTALQTLGEIRKQTELYSELTGELDRSTHIELRHSPEWGNVRDVIFAALQPYPEARVAVARALLAQGALDQAIAV